MISKKRVLALIPARSGSKGLSNKNIRIFCKKPLIAWTITAAKASKYIDKVIVSTDSPKIAKIARGYGAETPFLRPKQIATDKATAIQVVKHAKEWLDLQTLGFDIIVYLQPTSPLRTAIDIDGALKYYIKKNALSVISVSKSDKLKHLINILPKNRNMNNFIDLKYSAKNRQEFKEFYQINGAIYIADIAFITKNRSWYGNNTYAFIMAKNHSIDIDDILDFEIAQTIKSKGLDK